MANNLQEQFTHAFGMIPPRPTYLAPPPGVPGVAPPHYPAPIIAAGAEDSGFWKWVAITLLGLLVGGVTLYMYLRPTKPPPTVNEVLATARKTATSVAAAAAAPRMDVEPADEEEDDEPPPEPDLPAELRNDPYFTSLAQLMK